MAENPYSLTPALGNDLQKIQTRALIVGIIGLAACGIGAVVDPNHFFRGWLVGYVFWFGLGLGSLALLMLQHVTGGAWGLVIRRPLEAGSRTLLLLAVLFIPLLFGIHNLYEWARPEAAHDHVIQLKAAWLNVPGFIIRQFIYFAIWLTMTFLLSRWSLEQDNNRDLRIANRMQKLSGPGIVIYTITLTLAGTDWVMSLDPHWFSTIYGFLLLAGQGLSTFSLMTAVLILLASTKPMSEVITKKHLHDLGKFMLAFTMLWAYLSFSQLVIIWSGNLPEEITWYMRRMNNGWQYVATLLLFGQFVIPFLILLSQDVKKRPRQLTLLAFWIIAIRVVDIFWMIEPNFDRDRFSVSWLDVAAPVGIGGIWLWMFFRQLRQRPLMPINAPNLEQTLRHGRHH